MKTVKDKTRVSLCTFLEIVFAIKGYLLIEVVLILKHTSLNRHNGYDNFKSFAVN